MLKIRRYFVTGLLLVLPIFISFYILFVVFRFVDGIFGGLINSYLKANFGFFIPGIGFILGGATVLFSGFLATHFLGKKALPALERWFLKFPVIRQVYPSTKQIISFLFSKDKTSFKKVALVEYPSKGLWSVGFITNDGFEEAQKKTGEELVHVLIATTPSPWSGFLVLAPKKDIKFLDISVEDGMKLIISGGILKP